MRFCPLSQFHAHTPAAYSNQITLITSTVREEYKIKLKEKESSLDILQQMSHFFCIGR
jgi:hypothetical protein